MRTTLIAIASVMTMLAGSALAQAPGGAGSPTAPRTPGAGGPGAATPAPAPNKPAPNPLTMEDVSQIKGATVYGSDGKKIGSVSTVLMKPDSRQIDRLVVGAGGVLGIGAHDVALPVDQFSWDADKDGFKIAKTADELKSMPEWKAAGSEQSTSGSSAPSRTPATNR